MKRAILRRTFRYLFVAALLLAAAHRLPAPIVETPDNPTPAPEQAAKPKSKRSATTKSQPRSSEKESAMAPAISAPAKLKPTPPTSDVLKSNAKQQASVKTSRFAGTWAGVMPEVPWGNVATQLIVDQTETTMEWQNGQDPKRSSAKATLNGDTLSARFPTGLTTAVWYITPQPGGTTAKVRLTAFMNDQTAVFHRTAADSSAVKPTR